MQIKFDVSGLDLVVAKLEQLSIEDSAELMEDIAMAIKLQTIERFSTETDPDGAKWAPLKPSTIARKGSSGILKDTGALKNIVFTSGVRIAFIGAAPFYGVFHQWGTRHMPQRAFLGVNDDNMKDIENVVQAYFMSKGL
jgi:phage virion morphogenesis protein